MVPANPLPVDAGVRAVDGLHPYFSPGLVSGDSVPLDLVIFGLTSFGNACVLVSWSFDSSVWMVAQFGWRADSFVLGTAPADGRGRISLTWFLRGFLSNVLSRVVAFPVTALGFPFSALIRFVTVLGALDLACSAAWTAPGDVFSRVLQSWSTLVQTVAVPLNLVVVIRAGFVLCLGRDLPVGGRLGQITHLGPRQFSLGLVWRLGHDLFGVVGVVPRAIASFRAAGEAVGISVIFSRQLGRVPFPKSLRDGSVRPYSVAATQSPSWLGHRQWPLPGIFFIC